MLEGFLAHLDSSLASSHVYVARQHIAEKQWLRDEELSTSGTFFMARGQRTERTPSQGCSRVACWTSWRRPRTVWDPAPKGCRHQHPGDQMRWPQTRHPTPCDPIWARATMRRKKRYVSGCLERTVLHCSQFCTSVQTCTCRTSDPRDETCLDLRTSSKRLRISNA